MGQWLPAAVGYMRLVANSGRLARLLACGAAVAIHATALAQTTAAPDTPTPSRFERSATLTGPRPEVAVVWCCDVRTSPRGMGLGDDTETRQQVAEQTTPSRTARGSMYLHSGIAFPWRPGVTGEKSQTYVTEPGGWTTGWVAGGGAFLDDFLSLEGELSMTGVMMAVEPSRYFMTFHEERRDLFIVANLRFHLLRGRAVAFEPVAGFAVVRREGWSQVDRLTYRGPDNWVLEQSPREEKSLPPGVGLAFGADVRIGGRRVAVVPSFRAFRTTVSDEFANHYPGGASGWTVRPAILLRVDVPVV